uniref:RNA polymerase beta' subunit n=1 Tax=Huperzia selago TaxID=70001 RepID=UPI002E7725F0|nr:RNA polymerase beta' subunit [Huperzia selago]WRB01071.1 RNA polymerase beta' subunit [Huperzia selago]WRB01332.1 RNA polymerase beta' subunit [Huperzia serrata]
MKNKHQFFRIGLASPEQIRAWAERVLPTGEIVGEVTQPDTFSFGDNRPEKDGIFSEKIFGPIQTGVCACGKYKKQVEDEEEEEEEDSNFCKECGVEFVESRVRRYRMGYIRLACAVTHVWYLRNIPSYIATILSKPLQELENLAYCDHFFAGPVTNKPTLFGLKPSSFEYDEEDEFWNEIIPCFFYSFSYSPEFNEFMGREMATGGDAIQKLLANLKLKDIKDGIHREWKFFVNKKPTGDILEDLLIKRRKDFLVRRFKLIKFFIQTKTNPEWMVLSILPVLPPELRPMIRLNDGEIISSDINELYRRIIFRNNGLIDFLEKRTFTPEGVIVCQKKLVQEAVDSLFDNSMCKEPMTDLNGRLLKSFSDIIQGKEGRFRENLLGKRVDYSARSVIVVGPSLPLHQCGLPQEIAMELFQPFMIRNSIERNLVPSVRAAKLMIQNKLPFLWKILQEVMYGHPILLNRAPTLHRLGIQAFEPILADGRAIRLHPLVCAGFNADFDGDQMAVHLPLSLEAQAEASLLMLSQTNLLSPATGDPICVPSQDMLLGLYPLTIEVNRGIYGNRYNLSPSLRQIPYFYSYDDALRAKSQKLINLHSFLWLRWPVSDNLRILNSKDQEEPIEIQYDPLGNSHRIYEHFQIRKDREEKKLSIYICTTAGRTIFDQQIEAALQGFSKITPF